MLRVQKDTKIMQKFYFLTGWLVMHQMKNYSTLAQLTKYFVTKVKNITFTQHLLMNPKSWRVVSKHVRGWWWWLVDRA